ncbi:hypothetical protein NE865_15342 [Phthorimaea operculella]|nr:hypothetical protein NE865_15342 [Phthorimaea operculella]
MSSADSRTTSSSSRLSQFGIYRSIDARTEEFLRLSRKRQIRQGCACAAVSTAITVTIVIVILLIYEYAIVVETSLVQKIRNNNSTNETNPKPIADKLDSSYFGFDQDYYEKMPLLVNAMQENSYVDPSEASPATSMKPKARYKPRNISKTSSTTFSHRTNYIRRTSPRPFYYEYKSPTPVPFSKSYTSRSWIDSYRNAQRLKNLQQVIQYLEKTINAKFGDLYAPSSTIAFSGVYVEPTISQPKPTTPTLDLLSQASHVVEKYKSNHQSPDPLYNFKPDSPGDVNLLADGFFRFSPVPTPNLLKDKYATNIPMFRPIKYRKRSCKGLRCIETSESRLVKIKETNEPKGVESTSHDKVKTFSVMLNVFPLKPNNIEESTLDSLESTQTPINQIYLTTPRPTVQFRRKSTTPVRRTTTLISKPRTLASRRIFKVLDEQRKPTLIEPKMIVHVNVYPAPEIIPTEQNTDQVTTESNAYTTTTTAPPRYSTQIPMLTSTQVEDFHVGSSGIIPPEARLTPAPPPPIKIFTPTLPTSTGELPFIDSTSTSTEHNFRATNPPEILKFSHEDAKIPDHYKKIRKSEDTSSTSVMPGINRRNSQDVSSTEMYLETWTLTTKLKNDEKGSTENETTERSLEGTSSTVKTYVPQINGHYRSVNQNSRNINTWLNGSSPQDRKKRLEMSVTGFRKSTYVPQYVEIQRNNTRNTSDKDKE